MRDRLSLFLFILGHDQNRISAEATKTEAIDHLESDATGVYDTNPPYSSCGGEWVNIKSLELPKVTIIP